MFEQVLNKVTPNYEDRIDMYKINIEDEPELASIFKVMSIPFVVFISKDGEANANPGSMSEDTLKYYLDGLISK